MELLRRHWKLKEPTINKKPYSRRVNLIGRSKFNSSPDEPNFTPQTLARPVGPGFSSRSRAIIYFKRKSLILSVLKSSLFHFADNEHQHGTKRLLPVQQR